MSASFLYDFDVSDTYLFNFLLRITGSRLLEVQVFTSSVLCSSQINIAHTSILEQRQLLRLGRQTMMYSIFPTTQSGIRVKANRSIKNNLHVIFWICILGCSVCLLRAMQTFIYLNMMSRLYVNMKQNSTTITTFFRRQTRSTTYNLFTVPYLQAPHHLISQFNMPTDES